jgi:aminoglycoside phosphotransferase (APT) family kinase protein
MSESVISAERLTEINQQTVARKNMFYWQTDNGISMQERAILFGSNRESIDESYILDQLNKGFSESPSHTDLHVVSIGQRKLFTSQSHVNISCIAELSDGTSAVARVHPPGVRNGYFSSEAALITRAKAYGVPVVQSILARYGTVDGDLDFSLYQKVEGQDMKLYLHEHPDQENDLVRKAGMLMAAIHEVPVDGFGFFDNEYARKSGQLRGLHADYRDHCLAALDQNLADLVVGKYITESQAAKIKALFETTSKFKITQARIVHNDMADWNVIVDDGEIAAAIDWDEAHAGDPVADIACWSLFFSAERLKIFLEGYSLQSQLDDDFDEKLHLYRLRYLVSKMALRHKIYSYKKNEHVEGLIKAGLAALADESAFFKL